MEKENPMKRFHLVVPVMLIIFLVGCNLPGVTVQETPQSPDAVFTQAAQTVAAELTRVAVIASPTPNFPTPNIPTNTFTPTFTDTISPTSTNTPTPCNLASFVTDVTIPDNTQLATNQEFSKTWRIHNVGTCSWNSSYLLIFDHGDGIGVTTGYTQQLTTGVVNPDQMVDLTVNLKAPAAAGTYTGYWRLRDPNGVLFGITPAGGTFIVKIKVVATTAVTLNPVTPGTESGTIRSDAGPFADFTAGESNADITRTCEAFLSYNISGIPANATITEVKFDFTAYTVTGNPFGNLGVLNAYTTNYGNTLEPGDFVDSFPPGNIADWGSAAALDTKEASPELKDYLQSKLGTSRLQLRLQFQAANGGTMDRVTFTNPGLIITYTTP
jgi:hypothetical protein